MKLYLSSYKFGDEVELLGGAAPNGKIGYISNALDFSGADDDRRRNRENEEIATLTQLGLTVQQIDLRDYFSSKDKLEELILDLGALFVCGGNVFVLRQAMKLSGLDQILIGMRRNEDFLYSGYSAGICVLAPDLRVYAKVDDATDMPYEQLNEPILQGLALLEFAIMPHWDSDHPESKQIDVCIVHCRENNIHHKPLRDGEVIVIEIV